MATGTARVKKAIRAVCVWVLSKVESKLEREISVAKFFNIKFSTSALKFFTFLVWVFHILGASGAISRV